MAVDITMISSGSVSHALELVNSRVTLTGLAVVATAALLFSFRSKKPAGKILEDKGSNTENMAVPLAPQDTTPATETSISLQSPTQPTLPPPLQPSIVLQSNPVRRNTIKGLTPVSERGLDVYSVYERHLEDGNLSMSVAAILTLTEVIENSQAATMYELVEGLKSAASVLKQRCPNPVSLTAGCDLFIRYVTTARQDFQNFSAHKTDLVRQGKEYTALTPSFREKIANHAYGFIKEDAVILTHSYSRVVMKALLRAHETKRISVYVTEARPGGLGMKTYAALTAAGIPCTVILDSAIAYCMDKVDLVLVGSEAVVESGGLINAVGTLSMAIIAKASNKPFYALAESYKFLRFFPLSQYDLPINNSAVLSLPSQKPDTPERRNSLMSPMTPRQTVSRKPSAYFASTGQVPDMTDEQMAKNPDVDYTRPDLITLVFTDVGILTPDGISSFLVGVFAD